MSFSFKQLNIFAEKYVISGSWKPIFKMRYNTSYLEKIQDPNYEENLRKRIFKSDNDVVLRRNMYPFNLGKNLNQKIVWIKNKDPGIEFIENFIKAKFPNKDYHIFLNKEDHRSIKSILHYHVILQPKIENSVYLKKLIIFHRHSNREPIVKFPIFERILGSDNFKKNKEANLLPIGHENSKIFGQQIKKVYNLDSNFLTNVAYFSSPAKRCLQTAENVLLGLDLKNIPINIETKFRFDVPDNVQVDKRLEKYQSILQSFNEKLEFDSKNSVLELYQIFSCLSAYKDLGIETTKLLSSVKELILQESASDIYNICIEKLVRSSDEFLIDIIKSIINKENNLVICSAHDNLIFCLAKYFQIKNEVKYGLELPKNLSNIRIEIWSDDVKRIYYDNYYLGDIIE